MLRHFSFCRCVHVLERWKSILSDHFFHRLFLLLKLNLMSKTAGCKIKYVSGPMETNGHSTIDPMEWLYQSSI